MTAELVKTVGSGNEGSLSPGRALQHTSSSEYHPNLMLLHGLSPLVSDKGYKAGNFVINDLDLGPELPFMLVFSRRWHAFMITGGIKIMETYNVDNPISNEIKATRTDRAKQVDSRWGWSYLVYVPSDPLKNLPGLFAVFHPNVWSARPINQQLYVCTTPIDKREDIYKTEPYTNLFLLKSRKENRKGNTYYIPEATPLDPKLGAELYPLDADLTAAVAIFEKPVLSEPAYKEPTERVAAGKIAR